MPHARPTFVPAPTLPENVRRQLERAGTLESPWVWVGLTVAAVLALAGLIWWSRRQRLASWRKWSRRLGGGLAVLLLAAAAAGAGINSYIGYFPSAGSFLAYLDGSSSGGLAGPREAAGPGGWYPSQIVVARLAAPALDVRPGRLYVYLPPGYDDPANAARRYPVVYLLHGFPGRSADWFAAGQAGRAMDVLVANHLVPPMILASPDAAAGRGLYDSECLNAVRGPAEDTFLTSTVVSYVDAHYRTVRNRVGRAVGGMSSGGFCALNLGLRHTGTYSVILAQEPYGDPGRTGYAHLDWQRRLMAENTPSGPSGYLRTMPFRHPMAIMLDVPGANAADVTRARSLGLEIAARGQRVAFRVEIGLGHTWHAARIGLPYLLEFAGRQLTTSYPHTWETECRTSRTAGVEPAAGREPGHSVPGRDARRASRTRVPGATPGPCGRAPSPARRPVTASSGESRQRS